MHLCVYRTKWSVHISGIYKHPPSNTSSGLASYSYRKISYSNIIYIVDTKCCLLAAGDQGFTTGDAGYGLLTYICICMYPRPYLQPIWVHNVTVHFGTCCSQQIETQWTHAVCLCGNPWPAHTIMASQLSPSSLIYFTETWHYVYYFMQNPYYRCCTAMPIADVMNFFFHGWYIVTVVFLSTIWFATKDNKQGFKNK